MAGGEVSSHVHSRCYICLVGLLERERTCTLNNCACLLSERDSESFTF